MKLLELIRQLRLLMAHRAGASDVSVTFIMYRGGMAERYYATKIIRVNDEVTVALTRVGVVDANAALDSATSDRLNQSDS